MLGLLSCEGTSALSENRAVSGFAGRTVLSFESRRSKEIASLIERLTVDAPWWRPRVKEVPAENGADVSRFATALLQGKN